MLTTSSRKGKSRKSRNRDADRDSSRIPALQDDPDEGKDDEVDADVDSDVDETITRPWNYGFTEYTDAEKEANGDGGEDDDDDNASDAQQSSNGRNRRLLKIARTGMAHLDRSAVYIQKQPKTSRELATLSEEGIAPDRAQMAEEYRIFTTTQECLEILCTKDRNFPLMAGEEPILLVGCTVNASLTYADIYWCLPESVWTAPDLTEHQRHYIQEEMRARLAGEPGRLLAHSVTQRLAFYYAPKVRFKEAPREIIDSVVQEYEAN